MTLLTQIVNELPADWKLLYTNIMVTHEAGIGLSLGQGTRLEIVTPIDPVQWQRLHPHSPMIKVTYYHNGQPRLRGDAYTVNDLVMMLSDMIAKETVCGRVDPFKIPSSFALYVLSDVESLKQRMESVCDLLLNARQNPSVVFDREMTPRFMDGDK
jgi:hypothetical protein